MQRQRRCPNELVSDKDGKTWKVSNPDALKGHEGPMFRVRAHVDADKDKIHVTSREDVKERDERR